MFQSGVKPHDLNLCFLSNKQARDENESRITRLPGGKSFFQKPDAKPRAALGSIANTLVERNAAGKVSSVSMWFCTYLDISLVSQPKEDVHTQLSDPAIDNSNKQVHTYSPTVPFSSINTCAGCHSNYNAL